MTSDEVELPDEAHPQCVIAGKHVCQKPSGRICIENDCEELAGTWWTPLWCPVHDKERIDRIDANLRRIRSMYE